MAKSSEAFLYHIPEKWVKHSRIQKARAPHFSPFFLKFFPCGSEVGQRGVSTKWGTRLCQNQTSIIVGRNPELRHASAQLTQFAPNQNYPTNLSQTTPKRAKSRGLTSAFVLVGAGGFEPP